MKKIAKYYKNEIFSYWFGCLLPFIFVAEIMIYKRENGGISQDAELILQFIMGMCIVAGGLLSFSQIVSTIRFVKAYRSLPSIVADSVSDEIDHTVKRGRFLLTKSVLAYFGPFSKKLFDRNEISGWKRNKGVNVSHNPKAGVIKIPYDDTMVYLKKHRTELIEYPIDPLEAEKKTAGELPLTAMAIFIMVTVFFAGMIIYPQILEARAPSDPIERFLFWAANEAHYCLTAVIVSAITGIVSFFIRCLISTIKIYADKVKAIAICICVAAAFVAGFYADERKEAMLAEEDLNAYYNERLEVVEGIYKEKGACKRNEMGWSVYDYADSKQYDPVMLEDPRTGLILLRSAIESIPAEGKRYRIEYLKNTKIVVSLVEID